MNIALETTLARIPLEAIKTTVQRHIEPLEKRLPDKRLRRGVEDMIFGILGG